MSKTIKKYYKRVVNSIGEKIQYNDVRSLAIGLIICFVVINVLFTLVPARLDLSTGHAYTLSDSTKKILKNLSGKTTITLYMSSDLPLRLLPLKTDVVNLLNEYKRLAGNKIEFKTVDPATDAGAKKDVEALGIPQLQFSQIEKDKYAVSASYFGISLKNGDKTEIIPQAVNIESIEYDLSAALYKINGKETGTVGIIDPFGSPDPQQDSHYSFKSLALQQYSLEPVSTATDSATKLSADTYKTLIVFNSGEDIPQATISQISNYITNGGTAIFMVDGVSVSDQLSATPAQNNLFSMFAQYGITLNKDLVLSDSAEVANFTTGRTSFFTPYPFWVKTAEFDKSRSEFSNVGSLLFPWTSSVSVKKNLGAHAIVQTQNNAWSQTKDFTLLPNTIVEPAPSSIKQFSLIAEYASKTGGRLLVIPSSRFVDEQFIQRRSDNIDFVLNILNTYASGGALSGIRARSLVIIPLNDVPDSQKDMVKYLTMFLLPGLFGLLGLYRINKRTHES